MLMSQPDVLVGTREGLFRLREGHAEKLADGHFTALAREGAQWWAVGGSHEVWHSSDGLRWSLAGRLEGLRLNVLLPTAEGLLVGTSKAHLYRFRQGTFSPLTSFDTAPGRDGWYNPAASHPDVRSLARTPAGTLFVNVHVGGILRSEDGDSWAPTLDVDADVHQVLFEPSARFLLVAAAWGFGASADQGRTWRFETRGLHASYLRSLAVAGDTVLVSASSGPFAKDTALYRKPLRGDAPFIRCEQGLPGSFPENIDTFCLAAAGPAAAFGTSSGHVFLSLDEGGRWSRVTGELPPVRCLVIT